MSADQAGSGSTGNTPLTTSPDLAGKNNPPDSPGKMNPSTSDRKNKPSDRDRPDDDQQSDGGTTDDDRSRDERDADARRPSGTALIATVVTRSGAAAPSEQALNNANIALQIINSDTGPGTHPSTTVVGTDTLARIRRTFVAPPRLTEAWNVLADRHLLLLEGSPGDGREHLGTYLLDVFSDARVRLIGGSLLADVAEPDLTPGGGHLWIGPVDEELDQRVVETLAERLRRTGGYLIVRWPDDNDVAPELGDYVATAGRPDLLEVVRRHLPASATALLAREAVVEARTRLRTARQAVGLARLLGQVAADRTTLDDALARALGPEPGAADWFGDLPEREDQAFVMALTALDGLSLPSVVAGARLADELLQRTADPRGRYALRPLHRPVRALLAAVDAECVPEKRETGYGQVPITSVRFRRREGHARELLDAIWQSYPYLQEIYFAWAETLVRDPDPYVRERVAVVAGVLATHDFAHVHSRLLRGWAVDADEHLRRAAASALRPLVLHPALRETVWSLLDDWAAGSDDADDSTARQRLTAAVALGAPVGYHEPGRALELIRRRLLPHPTNAGEDYELWLVTALAVGELFGDGGALTSDLVLRQVREWAETKEVGPGTVAVAVLLALTGKAPAAAPTDDRRLPPLLRAVRRTPANLANAAVLWRTAIGHRQLADAALTGLRTLAEHVDDVGDGDAELTAMVEAIPETVRDQRTLRFATRRWLQDDPHPSMSADLHALLSGRGDQ